MALPFPDDGGIVRYTCYRVFRTVRLKTPQTGGARYDLARRVDYFHNSVTGPYQSAWVRERFKLDVEPEPNISDF